MLVRAVSHTIFAASCALFVQACADSSDDGPDGGITGAQDDGSADDGGDGDGGGDGSTGDDGDAGTSGDDGGDAGSGDDGTTGDGSGDAGSSDGTTGTGAGGPSFGSGSYFDSVEAMFEYVNGQRESYQPHDRYKGLPFAGGEYHTNVTWPMSMTWNEDATAEAQAVADAVAGGAPPTGYETMSNPGANHLFIEGVNTGKYMVTGKESGGQFATEACTMCNSNPFGRMAIFYHDPGGDGPVLTSLGVGASAAGADTWWVLIFE